MRNRNFRNIGGYYVNRDNIAYIETDAFHRTEKGAQWPAVIIHFDAKHKLTIWYDCITHADTAVYELLGIYGFGDTPQEPSEEIPF